jgi:hypothetical protein
LVSHEVVEPFGIGFRGERRVGDGDVARFFPNRERGVRDVPGAEEPGEGRGCERCGAGGGAGSGCCGGAEGYLGLGG